MVPLGTLAVAILYIHTSRTRFRSWSFYRYRKHFGDLDHCSHGHERWNRENKEFRIYQLKYYTWFSIEKRYWSITIITDSDRWTCKYFYFLTYWGISFVHYSWLKKNISKFYFLAYWIISYVHHYGSSIRSFLKKLLMNVDLFTLCFFAVFWFSADGREMLCVRPFNYGDGKHI